MAGPFWARKVLYVDVAYQTQYCFNVAGPFWARKVGKTIMNKLTRKGFNVAGPFWARKVLIGDVDEDDHMTASMWPGPFGPGKREAGQLDPDLL